MNRRPGQLKVTIEPGYCSFCDRTRNLRKEERQLGALVRTVTTCESCHRTVASTMGVAAGDTSPDIKGAAAETSSSTSPEQPVTAKPKAAKQAVTAASPKKTKPRAAKDN